jgi:hypothetical protein
MRCIQEHPTFDREKGACHEKVRYVLDVAPNIPLFHLLLSFNDDAHPSSSRVQLESLLGLNLVSNRDGALDSRQRSTKYWFGRTHVSCEGTTYRKFRPTRTAPARP